MIPVPVSADASGGEGDERLPIAETFQLEGPESLEREAEILLGLELDEVAVVDAEQLAALLAPFGALDVDLPVDVTDAGGDVVAEAGAQTLDAEAAAAVLTARDPAVPAVDQYPAAAAVWAADRRGRPVTARSWPPARRPTVMAAAFDGPVGVSGPSGACRTTPPPTPVVSTCRPRPHRPGARVRADRARQDVGAEPGAVRPHRVAVHRRRARRAAG